jgi:anti-sigma factor RsiW
MTCQDCHDFIDAYLDNELDVSTAVHLRQHMHGCSHCRELLESRKAVQTLLGNPQVRFEVPDSLFGKIQSIVPAASSSTKHQTRASSGVPWLSVPLALAAAIIILLGLAFLYQTGILDRSPSNRLETEIISNHVRSLLATHLLDVPSTDQHTVKPWFAGKLKFSPPVQDFADNGFRLIGGRLDFIDGREVAAVVYQRNKHVINMFIWPSESNRSTAAQSYAKDGYNLVHWARDGFEFWLVSDVNAQDLRDFADLEMRRS